MRLDRMTLTLGALVISALLLCQCESAHFGSAQLAVDRTILQFEKVAVGYPQQRTLKIENTGGAGLTLESIAPKGAASPFRVKGIRDLVSGEVKPLPEFVGPGSHVDLVVEYEPASETATDSDLLQVSTNDPDTCPSDRNPCEIQLNGSGAPPDADLQVTCQTEETCPDGVTPVCRIIPDKLDNLYPVRISLNYCEVAAGLGRELGVVLQNAGNIPLELDGIELDDSLGSSADFQKLAPADSALELAPGESTSLTLNYAPSAEGVDSTGMDIQTNDDHLRHYTGTAPNLVEDTGARGVLEVRLLALSASPHINVTPAEIDFAGVQQGNQKTETVTVNNTGTGTLVVSALGVTGGSLPGELSLSQTEGFSVAPGGQQTFQVTYHPQDVGADTGAVQIASNDPDRPQVTVVLGAEVRPDLEVTPSELLEFLGVPMGGSAEAEVVLRNLGYADLQISAIDLSGNPGNPPVFGLKDLPGTFPAAAIVLAPAQSLTFKVTFQDNTTIANENGQLDITHDSPNDPSPYALLLVSSGTPANLPPVAVIDPPSQTLTGKNRVALDGSKSFDPDAGDSIGRYSWSFLFLPKDAQGNLSQATLENSDQALTGFTPDMYGTYVVRLVVFDSYNTPSRPTDSEISVSQ